MAAPSLTIQHRAGASSVFCCWLRVVTSTDIICTVTVIKLQDMMFSRNWLRMRLITFWHWQRLVWQYSIVQGRAQCSVAGYVWSLQSRAMSYCLHNRRTQFNKMHHKIGSEVLTAVGMNIANLWDTVPCSLYLNRRFGGMYHAAGNIATCWTLVPCWADFQVWSWWWYVPPNRRFACGLHGTMSQKLAKFKCSKGYSCTVCAQWWKRFGFVVLPDTDAVAQWLGHYVTSRKVAGSRPHEVNEFFSIYLILSAALGPGVHSHYRNDYQQHKDDVRGE
jgi:hypothetical protein